MISTDLSCLMHLEGYIRHKGLPLKTLHIADVLEQWLVKKPPTMPRRQAGGDLKTTCRKSLAICPAFNIVYDD